MWASRGEFILTSIFNDDDNDDGTFHHYIARAYRIIIAE